MTRKRKVLMGLLALVLVIAILDAWIIHAKVPEWEPLWESTSPDQRFTVSVYYNPGFFVLPPWLHPRGRAGTVVLRENKTGKVLQRARADSVDSGTETPPVDWYMEFNEVGVTSVGVWSLPTD